MRLGFRVGPFWVSEQVGGRRRGRKPGPGFLLFVIAVALVVTVLAEVSAR